MRLRSSSNALSRTMLFDISRRNCPITSAAARGACEAVSKSRVIGASSALPSVLKWLASAVCKSPSRSTAAWPCAASCTRSAPSSSRSKLVIWVMRSLCWVVQSASAATRVRTNSSEVAIRCDTSARVVLALICACVVMCCAVWVKVAQISCCWDRVCAPVCCHSCWSVLARVCSEFFHAVCCCWSSAA